MSEGKTVHELQTERLHLRGWTAADRAPFAKLNGDPQVMRWFPAPLTEAESDSLADRISQALEDSGWGLWAVEVKGGAPFIGFVGLSVPPYPLPFGPCVEIGWRLDHPHWGKGYATEAARAALRFGFDTLGLERIVSFTSVLNLPSEAVMKRIGMTRQPQTFMHPRVAEGHPVREHCLYVIER